MSDKPINPLLQGAVEAGNFAENSPPRTSGLSAPPLKDEMSASISQGLGGVRDEAQEIEGREGQQVRFLQTKARETNFIFH